MNKSFTHSARSRPAFLRALGRNDPPEHLTVAGETYQRGAVLKHDSFAATAIYQRAGRKIICKFNRVQPVLGFPLWPLGYFLAARESRMLQRVADLDGFPKSAGPVEYDGRLQPHVTTHLYIEGRPLALHDDVDDAFFPRLERIVEALHRRDAAHVDLNKRENILVGEDGRPYLLDYQISFALARRFPGNCLPMRLLLRIFQRSDHYHLLKHRIRLRPDQLRDQQRDLERARPLWIRFWRLWTTPLRSARRALLVRLGVRKGDGTADTESDPEVGFRPREKAE